MFSLLVDNDKTQEVMHALPSSKSPKGHTTDLRRSEIYRETPQHFEQPDMTRTIISGIVHICLDVDNVMS